MKANRFYFIVMLAITAGLGYLTFQILRPFIAPIMWGLVLSIVFYPVYNYLARYLKWKSLSSFIVLVIIIAIIIGPFSYFSYLLISELQDVSRHMDTGNMALLHDIMNYPAVHYVLDWISTIFHLPFSEADIEKTLTDNALLMGKDLIGKIPRGLGSVVTVFINFIFMSLAIFFMFKDGAAFLRISRDYMPFSEQQKERLASQIRDIVISTIYGGVLVAVLEGIIGGIAYSALGLRSPVLWGATTAIASFIPMVGSFAVWGIIALYFFLQVSVMKGVILVLIGIFGISLIDYGLRPVLIGSRTRMPVIVIFFSVLGGIKFFGLLGLIMGPLVVALFVSVMDIFRNIETDRNPG
ncbi:MAG TPA: AI-2E family transporter [Dissulfurispiraceae bacterium]|nr:AI-2E family transporter [Dissulfurispiraceae bacterium]